MSQRVGCSRRARGRAPGLTGKGAPRLRPPQRLHLPAAPARRPAVAPLATHATGAPAVHPLTPQALETGDAGGVEPLAFRVIGLGGAIGVPWQV